MGDVFNNPSNNYSYPGLSPCVGVADDSYLDFLSRKRIGIISGRNIITEIDFSELNISVDGWNQQSAIIQSGEVIYVPGLSKGLCKKQQAFIIPDLDSSDEDIESYFMEIDLSINYYDNFKYIETNINAIADYDNNIDIQIALNQVLDDNDIKVSSTYDTELLTFTGEKLGYEFNISNVNITTIDASENESSPFSDSSIYLLEEDLDYNIPYAKYFNGASRGIIIRGIYPDDINEKDKWIYINHAPNYVTIFEAVDCSDNGEILEHYEKKVKKLDVGRSESSSEEIMSAGDYLQKITEDNEWRKISDFYMWTSAEDGDDCETKNLIYGFYIYNPQSFSIKVDYLIFV